MSHPGKQSIEIYIKRLREETTDIPLSQRAGSLLTQFRKMKTLNLRFVYGQAVRDMLLIYYLELVDFSRCILCIVHTLGMLLHRYDRSDIVFDETEADLFFAEMMLLLEVEDHLYYGTPASADNTDAESHKKIEITAVDND